MPDHTETHRAEPHCDACGAGLSELAVVETRQVFDLPRLGFEVTEHPVQAAQCAACGNNEGLPLR